MKKEVKPGRRVASFVPTGRQAAPARGPVYRALSRLDAWLEAHPAFRLLAIGGAVVTFAATAVAAMGVMIELRELDADREARQEERIERNRAILFARAGGDTGKAALFNRLTAQGAIGPSVDLSCRTIGVINDGECTVAPVLRGIELVGPTPGYQAEFYQLDYDLNLAGTVLIEARIDKAMVIMDLTDARVWDSDLTNTALDGPIVGAQFERTSLAGSWISSELKGTWFDSVNVSSTQLSAPLTAFAAWTDRPFLGCPDGQVVVTIDASKLDCTERANLPGVWSPWHWADRPPFFFPDWVVNNPDRWPVTICDPRDLPQDVSDEDLTMRMAGFCKTMSRAEAIVRYPLRWNPDVRCADRDDLRFLATDRTAPPQPCEIVED